MVSDSSGGGKRSDGDQRNNISNADNTSPSLALNQRIR
jgi:hypothetical protein